MVPAMLLMLNGSPQCARYVSFVNYRPGTELICPFALPQAMDSASSYFLAAPRSMQKLVCFLGGKPLCLTMSDDNGSNWSEPQVVTNSLDMCVTSLVTEPNGRMTAFFDSPSTDAIFSSFSDDGGATWSFPVVAFKHNSIGLERAVVARSGKGTMVAVIHEKNGGRVLVTEKGPEDTGWSYPVVLEDFNYRVISLSVRKSHIYMLFYDDDNIYVWRGGLASFSDYRNRRVGALLMPRTNYDNGPQTPVFVRTGRDFGYLFD